jgi:putative two-component system response regulator
MKVQSGFLEMAEQIARSHHERWDGDGYVECLKGDQIPLAARIFTMADIYDALTTERAYKAAFTHEEAVEAMREDRGRRFDPDVFDAFVEAGEDFNKVRQQYADE